MIWPSQKENKVKYSSVISEVEGVQFLINKKTSDLKVLGLGLGLGFLILILDR